MAFDSLSPADGLERLADTIVDRAIEIVGSADRFVLAIAGTIAPAGGVAGWGARVECPARSAADLAFGSAGPAARLLGRATANDGPAPPSVVRRRNDAGKRSALSA